METILVRALGFIAVIGLGYGLKIAGIVKKDDAGIFSAIVMNVTLPCALLASASSVTFSQELVLPLVFGFAMNLVMDAVGYWSARGKGVVAQSIGLVQISGYNIGTFTLPFVQAFFAPAYLVPVMLFDTGNALMVLGGNYTIAANLDRQKEELSFIWILKNLFGSIPFAVYLLTFLLAGVGFRIPEQVLSLTSIASQANPFLAMLMLGIMMDLKLEVGELLELLRLLGLRLFVSTIAGIAIYYLLPVSLILRQMLIICLFSPISVVAPVYAVKLGSSSEPANLNSLCILTNLAIMTVLILIFTR